MFPGLKLLSSSHNTWSNYPNFSKLDLKFQGVFSCIQDSESYSFLIYVCLTRTYRISDLLWAAFRHCAHLLSAVFLRFWSTVSCTASSVLNAELTKSMLETCRPLSFNPASSQIHMHCKSQDAQTQKSWPSFVTASNKLSWNTSALFTVQAQAKRSQHQQAIRNQLQHVMIRVHETKSWDFRPRISKFFILPPLGTLAESWESPKPCDFGPKGFSSRWPSKENEATCIICIDRFTSSTISSVETLILTA